MGAIVGTGKALLEIQRPGSGGTHAFGRQRQAYLLRSRSNCSTEQVSGQPGLHRKKNLVLGVGRERKRKKRKGKKRKITEAWVQRGVIVDDGLQWWGQQSLSGSGCTGQDQSTSAWWPLDLAEPGTGREESGCFPGLASHG